MTVGVIMVGMVENALLCDRGRGKDELDIMLLITNVILKYLPDQLDHIRRYKDGKIHPPRSNRKR